MDSIQAPFTQKFILLFNADAGRHVCNPLFVRLVQAAHQEHEGVSSGFPEIIIRSLSGQHTDTAQYIECWQLFSVFEQR